MGRTSLSETCWNCTILIIGLPLLGNASHHREDVSVSNICIFHDASPSFAGVGLGTVTALPSILLGLTRCPTIYCKMPGSLDHKTIVINDGLRQLLCQDRSASCRSLRSALLSSPRRPQGFDHPGPINVSGTGLSAIYLCRAMNTSHWFASRNESPEVFAPWGGMALQVARGLLQSTPLSGLSDIRQILVPILFA